MNKVKYSYTIILLFIIGCGNTNLIELQEKADSLFRNRNYTEAITIYTKVINLDNNNIHCLVNRGLAKVEIGNYQEAITDYKKAIFISPKNKFILSYLGKAYELQGNYKIAFDNYNKALLIDSNFILALNNRGLIYEEIGETSKAINDFNKVLAIDSTFCPAYNNRALSYQSINEYQKALDDCNKSINLCEELKFEPYFNKGVCELYLKQYNQSLISFNKAISINNNDPIAYYHRGIVYLKLKKIDNACEDWKVALDRGYIESKFMIDKYCNNRLSL